MVMMLSLKPPMVYPSTGGAAGGERDELSPPGRRLRARRPMIAKGSDGGSLSDAQAGCGEMRRRDVRPPSDW